MLWREGCRILERWVRVIVVLKRCVIACTHVTVSLFMKYFAEYIFTSFLYNYVPYSSFHSTVAATRCSLKLSSNSRSIPNPSFTKTYRWGLDAYGLYKKVHFFNSIVTLLTTLSVILLLLFRTYLHMKTKYLQGMFLYEWKVE